MKPEDTLKKTTEYLKNLDEAKRLVVAVGLPKGRATSKVYKTGITVVEVGTIHEFGAGNNPTRSFLRVPFKVKKNAIQKAFISLFRGVAEKGLDAKTQLGKGGVLLENISKEAFETKGYGTWKDIGQSTKQAKGSSAILINDGILRGSITHEVRSAT